MRACLAVWTEGLLVLPVVLAVFRGCGGGTPWPWLAWLAAAGAVGAVVVRLGLRRTGSVLAAALVAGGVTWVLAGAGWGSEPGGAWLAGGAAPGVLLRALLAAGAGTALLRGARAAGTGRLPGGGWLLTGFLVYFAAGIVYGHIAGWRDLQGLVTVAGWLAVAVVWLAANADYLRASVSSHQGAGAPDASVVRANRRHIAVLWALALLISAWRQLAAAVRAAWHAALVWVWQMVAAVLRWLTPPAAPHRVPPQAARPKLPPAHASPWAAWLDRVLPWVVGAALCACAVYLLWRGAPRVVRWLRQAVAWLWRRLGREAEPAYVEEVESLPVWRAWADAWRKARALRRDSRAVWPRWEELSTPAARIRYLYRWLTAQAARRGLPVPPHDTPQEAAARIEAAMAPACPEISELAHWYNEVRYGERPGDAAAAERLYQALAARFGERAARGGATRGDARRAPKRVEMRRDRERSGDGIKRLQ